MKAIILVAGEGNRMHPLTYTRPKVMLPLANKPILEHLLTEAIAAGVKEFVLITGYHQEQVRNYFGNGVKWQISIDYCTQRRQLGTADAIRMAEGLVKDNFLVLNGDIIVSRTNIKNMMAKKGNSMSVVDVDKTKDLGVIEVKRNRVTRIYEKMKNPPSRLANAGLYLFTSDIFEALAQTPKSPRGEYEITTSLQLMIDRGQPVFYQNIDYWLDVTYPWDLLSTNGSLLPNIESKNDGTIEDNAIIKGTVSIGKGTVIRSGSYIIGPVIVGQNCEIGPNCYIRPHTSIGDNCHIGHAVEVKNCIIMKGTKIPHFNYVGDSVIGESCNFGAGTKIANLRLDKKSIKINDTDTGRKKLGAIIGDRVETGINTSINVGTRIGNNAHIGPGAIVTGTIAPDTKIL